MAFNNKNVFSHSSGTQNSKTRQARLPPGALGESQFFAPSSSWWLSPCLGATPLLRLCLLLPVCLKSPSAFLLSGCLTLDLGFTRITPDPLLNSICKNTFSKKAPFTGPRDMDIPFGGPSIQPISQPPMRKTAGVWLRGQEALGLNPNSATYLVTEMQSFLRMSPTPSIIPVTGPSGQ